MFVSMAGVSETVEIDENADPIEPAEAAIALDLLLTEAALGTAYHFRPRTATLRMAAKLAANPAAVAKRTRDLAAELTRIAAGKSSVEPHGRDRRFSAEEWQQNPLLRRVLQSYLAAGKTAEDLLADADLSYDDHEKADFLIRNINEALAPSNNPLLNPDAIRTAKQTKGKSALTGAKAFAQDMQRAPRLPEMVSDEGFVIGENIAASPGAVIFRTEMFELIQYEPTTEKVYRHPLIIIPPMINKFYAVDLAPGRSMVEYLLGQGQQVFAISWRNPTAENRDWGFDEYGASILEAIAAAREITSAKKVNLYAMCSGGIVTSMTLAHLAKVGEADQISGLGLAVTVLDQDQAGLATAALDNKTAKAAIAVSASRGYLDGRHLAEAFAWLRPTDLVWGYWINNYLLGRKPPRFDVLFWNADTTRMAAALHKDFVETGVSNALAHPGQAKIMGTKVDLGTVGVDSYIVAGVADHICPWSACYASTQLLGGDKKFVLSNSGHIAAIVNPPTNPKATYRVAESNPANFQDWYAQAHQEPGSWWEDFAKWLARRGGGKKLAPKSVGDDVHPALSPAPGTYILEP